MTKETKQESIEIHKPARRNYPRRAVMVKGIDDTWCIDLVDMTFDNNEKVIKENQGFKYLLTCIDVLSRYAWAIALKDKRADTVLTAIKHIIRDSGRRPKKIWSDEGSEFKGIFKQHFDSLSLNGTNQKYACPYGDTCGYKSKVSESVLVKHLKSRAHHFSDEQIDKLHKHNFKLTIAEIDRGDEVVLNNLPIYHTYSDFHASPIERFNRTLKNRMWLKMDKKNSREWVSRLDKLVRKYNNTIHSSTGLTPAKASKKENEKYLLEKQKEHADKIAYREPKLDIGDYVRIAKWKKKFEKGYVGNWSKEIFRIVGINFTRPVTYRIEDLDGELIHGSWYTEELQKSAIKPSTEIGPE